MTVVLTAKQIEDLAAFAKEDGQPQYTITTGTIPEFEADNGEIIPGYTGLSPIQNHWITVYCNSTTSGITAGIH